MQTVQLFMAIKSIIMFLTIAGLAIYLHRHGKLAGIEESKRKIEAANKRAEKVRDNVEDTIRNTPDTVVDDELEPWVRP